MVYVSNGYEFALFYPIVFDDQFSPPRPMDSHNSNIRGFYPERAGFPSRTVNNPQVINLSGYDLGPQPIHDLTVSEAVKKYISLRLSEGLPPDGDTVRHLRKHLEQRFCSVLGGVPLKELRADHIRMWASQLLNEETKSPFAPLTVRHHLIDVKTFCKRAHGEGWTDKNPSLVVALPQIEEEDVNIMTVYDAFHFFKVNRDHRAIGRLALEAFGGIRYTTAGKLEKENIKFPQRGIEMPSAKHKSRKRKFRQGHPDNLWTWIEHTPESCWGLTLRQYADEKREMHVTAKLRPMVLKSDEDKAKAGQLHNVWRHSFASYLLARTKSYQPVSYLMQHTNSHTTEGYEGIATEMDGRLYFSITPVTVLMPWDEFRVLFEKENAR
jgi:site-specific recombinase XerD